MNLDPMGFDPDDTSTQVEGPPMEWPVDHIRDLWPDPAAPDWPTPLDSPVDHNLVKLCGVLGCRREHRALGRCRRHYDRAKYRHTEMSR